jgi:hypothetical protein
MQHVRQSTQFIFAFPVRNDLGNELPAEVHVEYGNNLKFITT